MDSLDRGGRMMKTIAKVMEFIGLFILLCGAGAMDNEVSVVIPIAMLITGMAIIFSGVAAEGQMR